MSLKGQFEWVQSKRQGGRKIISLTLTCTNIFQSEKFDAALIAASGQPQPMFFRQQTLPAKKSFRFDFDTVGWDWCQGDMFALLDKKGNVSNNWVLNMATYNPGECPECHGTKKCNKCGGTGMISNLSQHTVSVCDKCNGTGLCQTCYIPVRNIENANPATDAIRQRKIALLKNRINELQKKIEDSKWNERMMQLKGTDFTSSTVYMSQANLTYKYEIELINLQSQLEQLEQMQL